MYEVADDAPTDGEVYLYSWFFELEFGQMLAADGTFAALGADPGRAIMKSIDKDMKADVEELGDVELAAELAAWLTAVLSSHTALRRMLVGRGRRRHAAQRHQRHPAQGAGAAGHRHRRGRHRRA